MASDLGNVPQKGRRLIWVNKELKILHRAGAYDYKMRGGGGVEDVPDVHRDTCTEKT